MFSTSSNLWKTNLSMNHIGVIFAYNEMLDIILIVLFFILLSGSKNRVAEISYGGVFVNDSSSSMEKRYVGGKKVHFKVNVEKI